MTRLAKSTFTIALVTLLVLAVRATADAACSGSKSTINKQYSTTISPSQHCTTKVEEEEEEEDEEVVDVTEDAETEDTNSPADENTNAPAGDDADEVPPAPSPSDLGDATQDEDTTKVAPCSHTTGTPPQIEDKSDDAQAEDTTSATPASTHSNPSATPTPTVQLKYMVVQERKPGTGLDLNDTADPAVDRGTFDTRLAADQTAELWRDVMPGWEVEVVEVSVNK